MSRSFLPFILATVPINVALLFILMGFLGFGVQTYDETPLLISILENQSSQKVLGASTRENLKSLCPLNKPIVGWIDFEGKKTIQQDLPKNQQPSACFTSVEDANNELFYYKTNQ